jgi:hypothetical protein
MNTFERTILIATVVLGLCANALRAEVATEQKTLTLDDANIVIAAAKAERIVTSPSSRRPGTGSCS